MNPLAAAAHGLLAFGLVVLVFVCVIELKRCAE